MKKILFLDIDGVLCENPTPEENDDGEKYIEFLRNARPKYVPTKKIGYLITSRLEKYRAETEYWLKKHGVEYDQLIMCPYQTAEERRRRGNHAIIKAIVYSQLPGTVLFVESERWQAIEIARRTFKPVFCTENQQCYTSSDFESEKKRFILYARLGRLFPQKIRKRVKFFLIAKNSSQLFKNNK